MKIDNLNGELSVITKRNITTIQFRFVWINAEKLRPKAGDIIITESAVGLFWGIFDVDKSGSVVVEGKFGKHEDRINWEDIYRWVPYPNDEK